MWSNPIRGCLVRVSTSVFTRTNPVAVPLRYVRGRLPIDLASPLTRVVVVVVLLLQEQQAEFGLAQTDRFAKQGLEDRFELAVRAADRA